MNPHPNDRVAPTDAVTDRLWYVIGIRLQSGTLAAALRGARAGEEVPEMKDTELRELCTRFFDGVAAGFSVSTRK
ncbi:MAG: hypothetical protein HC777_00360, partial [Hyphomonadaceae bacterium]|nr:hypothetical protein [Hyphomonadaceae bacterium]